MRRKRIETMNGAGTVTSNTGEKVAVEYVVEVHQDQVPAGHMQDPYATIPGLISYEGRVLPVCFFANRESTLEMKDGRKLKFFFRDTNGYIAASGGIE